MKQLLESPKLFAIASILFAIATFVNIGTVNGSQDVDSILPTTGTSLTAPAQVSASPTIPPDPWEDPPLVASARVINASPTIPPDPWEDPPASIKLNRNNASPTIPPDPWEDPPASVKLSRNNASPTIPPDPWEDPPQVRMLA